MDGNCNSATHRVSLRAWFSELLALSLWEIRVSLLAVTDMFKSLGQLLSWGSKALNSPFFFLMLSSTVRGNQPTHYMPYFYQNVFWKQILGHPEPCLVTQKVTGTDLSTTLPFCALDDQCPFDHWKQGRKCLEI